MRVSWISMTVSHTWTSMYIKCRTMFYHLFWIIITVITKHMLRTWVKWEKNYEVFSWTLFFEMTHQNFEGEIGDNGSPSKNSDIKTPLVKSCYSFTPLVAFWWQPTTKPKIERYWKKWLVICWEPISDTLKTKNA